MSKYRKDIVPVDIDRTIYDKLSVLAKAQKTSLRKYVNQVLAGHVAIAPYYHAKFFRIGAVGATETGILVEDKSKNAIARIDLNLKDGSLHCSLDNKDFCEHIFATLLSEHWVTFFQRQLSKRD